MTERETELKIGRWHTRHALYAAYGLYCLAAVAGLLAAFYPQTRNQPALTETTDSRATITAEYSQNQEGDYASRGDLPYISTVLSIDPPNVAKLPDTVTVNVKVSQNVEVFDREYEVIRTKSLDELNTPVHMLLESSDFDFVPGSNERIYRRGAIVPFTAAWTAAPRRAGKLQILLRLKNIRNLALFVDGVARAETGNSDIPIPVIVLETSGLTPWQQHWLLWIVAALGAICGFIVQLLCSQQNRKAHTAQKS